MPVALWARHAATQRGMKQDNIPGIITLGKLDHPRAEPGLEKGLLLFARFTHGWRRWKFVWVIICHSSSVVTQAHESRDLRDF